MRRSIGSASPPQTDRGWLAVSEQRLLELTVGEVFRTITGELADVSIDGLPLGATDQWVCNEDAYMSAEHMKALSPARP